VFVGMFGWVRVSCRIRHRLFLVATGSSRHGGAENPSSAVGGTLPLKIKVQLRGLDATKTLITFMDMENRQHDGRCNGSPAHLWGSTVVFRQMKMAY
jgi:hypothetical protein